MYLQPQCPAENWSKDGEHLRLTNILPHGAFERSVMMHLNRKRDLQVVVREQFAWIAGEGHTLGGHARQTELEGVVLENLGDLAPRVPSRVPHQQVAEVSCTVTRYSVFAYPDRSSNHPAFRLLQGRLHSYHTPAVLPIVQSTKHLQAFLPDMGGDAQSQKIEFRALQRSQTQEISQSHFSCPGEAAAALRPGPSDRICRMACSWAHSFVDVSMILS